ncbi:MAG: 1,4-alpha-glucan branching protein domain-containing protein [Vulcanimicrobiota bacterium]
MPVKTKNKNEIETYINNAVSRVEGFKSEKITGETFGDQMVVYWDEKITDSVNYLDEDLYIQLLNPADEAVYKEERVNFLNQKDIVVEDGRDYIVRLVVKEKFRFSVATTSEFTPRVTFIPEGIGRYLLTWGELEWGYIRNQIMREYDIDWDNDIEVALKIVRWDDETMALSEEIHIQGMNDMEMVGGNINDIYLLVLNRHDKTQLKEIFRINIVPGEVKKVLDQGMVRAHEVRPYFFLNREVRENDASNLLAVWNIPDEALEEASKKIKGKKKFSDFDILLKLYYHTSEGWIEFKPDTIKKVMSRGNWYFSNVGDGTDFQAKLVLFDPKKEKELEEPLMVSNHFYFPAKKNEVTLLPIDESRVYAYWHLNKAEIWQRLVEKHDATAGNVKYFIKMFHDYAGGLHHHGHLDAEFNMDFTDSYYLEVEPDKVYRAQLIAVVDGWKIEELTPVSNTAQTMRLEPGNAPVNFVEFSQPQDHPTNRRIRSVMNTADYSLGKMILHLHAHLPYVGKRINYGTSGFWRPGGYIEEWYHEAARETYIPLIDIYDQLVSEGIDFKISMDISPTLCNMMRNPMLQEEFLNYIDSLISLAKTEIERTSREEPWYTHTARMHLNTFRKAKSIFLKYERDLTKAFKKFQDLGHLEISTCGATHGFLPLMGSKYTEAIRGQIRTAVIDYEEAFGRKPYGIWLPECAYTPGIEHILEENGLRYFFTETHTLLQSDSRVDLGVHAPAYVKGSQVAIFARDPETGKQVWSGDEGYPGDPDYLEFHMRGGPLKYNRITDRRGSYKQPYVPEWAESKAISHAQHFMENRNFRFEHIHNWFWRKPLIVATYDAELFGHHWYEGPRFLYYMLKKMFYDQNQTELTTPSHYLAENQSNQEVFPAVSSWGDKGTFDKWMYGSVAWMYRHMNEACEEMINLSTWAKEEGLMETPPDHPGVRMLAQMARYLLLSQNSDHGFNISNGHFVDRIKELFFEDLHNFWILANMFVTFMNDGYYDEVTLRKLEKGLEIFPVLDPFAWVRR